MLILVLLTVLNTFFVELTSPIFLLLSSILHVLVSFNVCF